MRDANVFFSLFGHSSCFIPPSLPVLGGETKQKSVDYVQRQGHSARGFRGK
jgi:hypothetical protein